MTSRHWCVVFLALLVLGPSGARGQKYKGRELVEARLLADVESVSPGQPLTAGLLLKMAPGWHSYWQFAGDAGIPTEIKWQLPPGWKAGPIQWPVPLKLDEPGDIQIYGYHDEVLLLVPLTPPPKIDAASVHLAAEANWLVCEKICIPGGTNVQLDLPVGSPATPANSELFTKFRQRLPQALPENARATLRWQRLPNELQLTIADKSLAQSPTVDFFPLPEAPTITGHPRRSQAPDGSLVFTIPVESRSEAHV